MLHEASARGCTKDIGMSKAKTPHYCEHGNFLVYVHQLGSKKNDQGGRHGTLGRGRGFAASPAQQRKVKGRPCVVCGQDGFEAEIHAAHVYPRRLQSCECAEGVVPLCRGCHGRYDDQANPFDLLRHLVIREYHAELVHAVAVHQVPIRELLDQVTGVKWAPVSGAVAA
jgi:hypothetical protein